MFRHVDAYPGDPILTLNEDFQKDPRQGKINLSIGIYFDNEGRLPVMVHADESQQIQAAVAFCQRYGLKLILHGGYDAPRCAELLKQHNRLGRHNKIKKNRNENTRSSKSHTYPYYQ